jgi:hypothetical protein
MVWIFAAWPIAGATWLLFLGEAFVDNYRILTGRAPLHAVAPVEEILPERSAE